MNIEEIRQEVESALKLSTGKCYTTQAANIPSVFNLIQRHYWYVSKKYNSSSNLLQKLEYEYRRVLMGVITSKDMKDKWKVKHLSPSKIEAQEVINNDSRFDELREEIKELQLLLKFLEDAMKQVTQNGYLIKTMLEYDKMQNGI